MIEFPPFRLDARAGRLWRGNRPVPLRPKAWALLGYLAARPGILVPKEELLTAIWGDAVVSDETLTRALAELRQALGDSARTPRIIETVHRRGVRFIGRTRSIDSWAPAPVLRDEPDAPSEFPLVGRSAEMARLLALFARWPGLRARTRSSVASQHRTCLLARR